MVELAVVLITRNQAWNVSRLVRSVARETARLPGTQLVLVDSASHDDTAALAAREGADVVSLTPDQPLTPAAGRYVGYHRTSADRVLFLDGDMELIAGWLPDAMRIMDAEPDIAAVSGRLIEVPIAAAADPPAAPTSAAMSELPAYGGAALLRRSVLERVGTFNPFLRSEEEPELCLRIRAAGFRVVGLDRPVAYHFSEASSAISTLVARRRRGLYMGFGQVIRYHARSGLLRPYLRRRGWAVAPGLALGVGVVGCLGSRATRQLVVLGIGGVIGGDAWRKRSLRHALFSVVQRLFILEGTVRGFLRAPLRPDSYPAHTEAGGLRSDAGRSP